MMKKLLDRWMNFKLDNLEKNVAYNARTQYLNDRVLNCGESGISGRRPAGHETVVSLTTYGRRFYDVYLAIESIMQQTVKPDRIVLWLGNEMKGADVPQALRRQQERGLDIRYCQDTGSYKKLVPALEEFPDAVIITVDDDALYPFDLLENLLNSYNRNPDSIHCARMHRMVLRRDGKRLEKYSNWIINCGDFDISPLNFPTGVGGVLYPPGCFTEEVFNESVFLDICRYGDDIWFKAMSLLNGTASRRVVTHSLKGVDYLSNENVQDAASLSNINLLQSMNDIQLKAVFDRYGLYRYLSAGNVKAEP